TSASASSMPSAIRSPAFMPPASSAASSAISTCPAATSPNASSVAASPAAKPRKPERGTAMADRYKDNLGYYFRDTARKFPDKIALIDLSQAKPREVTYKELDHRHDRFAALLTQLGMKAGDRLAMSIGNRFEFVEVMYGAMR